MSEVLSFRISTAQKRAVEELARKLYISESDVSRKLIEYGFKNLPVPHKLKKDVKYLHNLFELGNNKTKSKFILLKAFFFDRVNRYLLIMKSRDCSQKHRLEWLKSLKVEAKIYGGGYLKRLNVIIINEKKVGHVKVTKSVSKEEML